MLIWKTPALPCLPAALLVAARVLTSTLFYCNSLTQTYRTAAFPPQADPERVKRQLLAESVELEEYGGDVQVVETAATAGQGLAELEEALLLQAEVMELAAPSSGAAQGLVVEAQVGAQAGGMPYTLNQPATAQGSGKGALPWPRHCLFCVCTCGVRLLCGLPIQGSACMLAPFHGIWSRGTHNVALGALASFMQIVLTAPPLLLLLVWNWGMYRWSAGVVRWPR
jgi:hypothetical protein